MLNLFLRFVIQFDLYSHACEGDSISNQPDLFLTDQYSQDLHSVFCHHFKTYVQNLNIIGSLVGNLLRL